jgi:hypothetical protein
MAAIYDKALKRKDFSGIVSKDMRKPKEDETANASESPSLRKFLVVFMVSVY